VSDYSLGRSVIVVGPELKLHQCGFAEENGASSFRRLFTTSWCAGCPRRHLPLAAREMVERQEPDRWGHIPRGVIREHPALLNRAPTFHRLNSG